MAIALLLFGVPHLYTGKYISDSVACQALEPAAEPSEVPNTPLSADLRKK
jgi:hypothetical protein